MSLLFLLFHDLSTPSKAPRNLFTTCSHVTHALHKSAEATPKWSLNIVAKNTLVAMTYKRHTVLLLMVQKSCTSRYCKYPIILRVSYIPGGCLGFLPPTVSHEYHDCHSNCQHQLALPADTIYLHFNMKW